MAVRTVMDDVLDRAVASGRIPGVVAMAANADGLIYEGAFGKRESGGAVDMSLDTVFHIASMTKAVTSVAALQLVERGALQLDEPIGPVLPALASPSILDGWADDGTPRLRPARRPITLRRLLSHTAGFVYPVWNDEMKRYAAYVNRPDVDPSALPTPDALLMFEPGERWEYGTSTDWVGRAVEGASGQDLDADCRDHIFAPLDMHDTGFIVDAGRRARLTARHQRTGPGTFDVLAYDPPERPTWFNGGGGLYSTGPDYLTFLRALLHGGTLHGATILRPETVASLYENQIGELAAGVMRSVRPETSCDADFFPGMVKKWSLAGLITPEPTATGRSAGSLAWGGIANTYYWLDPTRKVAGLILTQLLPFADPTVLEVFGQFERAVYDSLSD